MDKKLLCLLAGVIATVIVSIAPVAALTTGTYGSGTYGSCEYGEACGISLSSDANISLDITPATGGKCTIQSDTASVLTDNPGGYTLTLANSNTDTALSDGSGTIDATSADIGSPAALSANEWGYRVDGLGSFGAGPTTGQSNIDPPGTVFAGIKASDETADTIAVTSSPANPAEDTTVWYGACANTSVSSGVYTTEVTYTAVAN